MKYCEEYAALLDLFVDGELSPDELERVRAHLETCPGCRAYVDDALAIRAGFPDVEDTAVPEGFAESVMERIREDAGKSAKIIEMKRRSVRRWAGSLAALAACCGLVILLRTGYGGGAGKSMAASGADAPAACDMAGGEEAGIEPRTAETPELYDALSGGTEMDAAPEEEQKLTAGQAENQMTAKSDMTANGFAVDRAAPADGGGPTPYVSSAGAPPEAAADAAGAEPALRLTAEEAGTLLDGCEPVWENADERCYKLNAEEYRALLEALGRPEELEDTAAFVVIVTEPPGE